MARYSPEHKEETRRRMIATAGRRFKSDGIDGSGIATLVADAGLTNGAFYGHFASKDDLVASVVASSSPTRSPSSTPCPPASRRSRRSSASTSPPRTATISPAAAPPQPCWTRSGGATWRSGRPTPMGPAR